MGKALSGELYCTLTGFGFMYFPLNWEKASPDNHDVTFCYVYKVHNSYLKDVKEKFRKRNVTKIKL